MFVSVVLALVLSQLLRPLVDKIEVNLGLSRVMSATIIFLSLVTTLGVLFALTFPFLSDQLRSLQNEMPNYISEAIMLSGDLTKKLDDFMPITLNSDFMDQIRTYSLNRISAIAKNLPSILANVLSISFLSFFIAFFMVKDSYKIRKGFLNLVPNHIFATVLTLTHRISQQISRFIQVRILEAFIIGLITCVGLQVISFPFAILLGIFAGVMNLVPYLGPILGILPAILVAFVNNQDLVGFITLGSVYVIAQVIDNLVIIPLIVARMMKLHPVTVLVLVAIGAQFLGILGMIISIPFAIAIQVIYRAIYEHIIEAESV